MKLCALDRKTLENCACGRITSFNNFKTLKVKRIFSFSSSQEFKYSFVSKCSSKTLLKRKKTWDKHYGKTQAFNLSGPFEGNWYEWVGFLTTISLWATAWTSGKAPSGRWIAINHPTESHTRSSSILTPANCWALQKTLITKAVNLKKVNKKAHSLNFY